MDTEVWKEKCRTNYVFSLKLFKYLQENWINSFPQHQGHHRQPSRSNKNIKMRRGNNNQAERGTNVGQKQVCRGRSGKQIKKINIRKKPKVETADQVMSHLPRCFFFLSLIKQLQKMHQKQFVNELKTEACSLVLIKSSGSPHSSLKAFDGWPWWLNRVHGCKDYGFGLVT